MDPLGEEPPRPSKHDEGATSDVTILVADDDKAVQTVMKRLLPRQGYSPDVVADGFEALQASKLRPYRLIISDYEMPRMNGMEFGKSYRAWELEHSPETRAFLVCCSGAEKRPDWEAAGFDFFIAKPINKAKLLEMLQAAHLDAN